MYNSWHGHLYLHSDPEFPKWFLPSVPLAYPQCHSKYWWFWWTETSLWVCQWKIIDFSTKEWSYCLLADQYAETYDEEYTSLLHLCHWQRFEVLLFYRQTNVLYQTLQLEWLVLLRKDVYSSEQESSDHKHRQRMSPRYRWAYCDFATMKECSISFFCRASGSTFYDYLLHFMYSSIIYNGNINGLTE